MFAPEIVYAVVVIGIIVVLLLIIIIILMVVVLIRKNQRKNGSGISSNATYPNPLYYNKESKFILFILKFTESRKLIAKIIDPNIVYLC